MTKLTLNWLDSKTYYKCPLPFTYTNGIIITKVLYTIKLY